MSGDVARTTQSSSASTTPRSKLDTLSRDELIYFVKKQVENLKLCRAKNARLSEEVSALTNALKDSENNLKSAQENEVVLTANYGDERLRLQQENEDLKNAISNSENHIEELRGKLEDLEAVNNPVNSNEVRGEETVTKALFDEKVQKLSELGKQNEELQCTVNELRCLLDDTNQELSVIKEKRNVENVFSLEIADYEKSVEKLQKELKVSKENVVALNNDLNKTRDELYSVREEKQRINASASKMKAAIVKLKSTLEEKKSANETAEKEVRRLEQEVKKINNDREEEKLSLSEAIGSKEEKIRQLEEDVLSMNRQVLSLRSVKESLQRQYDDLFQEYNTFKTRALYVLEQKKKEVTQYTDDQVESLEDTIRSQKKNLENVMHSHRILQDELIAEREHSLALTNKLQEVERQANASVETYKKKLIEQRQQFELRLASEAKLNADLVAQIDANFAAHTKEKERLIKEFDEEKKAGDLKIEKLKRSFEEERRKFEEIEHVRANPNVTVPIQLSQSAVDINSSYYQRPKSVMESFSTRHEEEVNDKTLEEVLYGKEIPDSIAEEWRQFGEIVNWEDVARKTQKQLENIREILSESEAANARLMEQAKLLKAEIRRMERNGERPDHVANTEYLKNIIIKFIAPEKVSSEREQLIPVLATMLRLSNDELQLLNSVAQADSQPSDMKPVGWGSYLHRWSGFS